MSYMVIFRTPEGKPGYQQAEEVHEVVETVERLRNEDGVENVRIYRMEEVAFEYKVRYTVELKDPSGATEDTPAVEAAPSPAPATETLSWDDDEAASGDAPAPFDQMAVDHTEAPRWGEPAEEQGEPVGVGDEGDDSQARRGLFGR
ncbi:hypothetical protein [Actinomarinicola tropica]|uniref:Uncharacterized protein n=1 Tax=Actinomarinicola tropica TaxID=2789776 RepID=A0A5Q2RGN4_9ACTN|nr:hypothetical protein [Actinomarinicola tropica]QGG93982.1 hypothetical protein GH723_02030 [Actinomarinicola tropica]